MSSNDKVSSGTTTCLTTTFLGFSINTIESLPVVYLTTLRNESSSNTPSLNTTRFSGILINVAVFDSIFFTNALFCSFSWYCFIPSSATMTHSPLCTEERKTGFLSSRMKRSLPLTSICLHPSLFTYTQAIPFTKGVTSSKSTTPFFPINLPPFIFPDNLYGSPLVST